MEKKDFSTHEGTANSSSIKPISFDVRRELENSLECIVEDSDSDEIDTERKPLVLNQLVPGEEFDGQGFYPYACP